jgi:hypothetical protein
VSNQNIQQEKGEKLKMGKKKLLTFLLFLLLLPLESWGKLLITPSGTKEYYFPGEKVEMGLKLLSSKPMDYNFSFSRGVEVNISHPSSYIYDLNLSFYASKKSPEILIHGPTLLKTIKLSKYIHLKPVPKPYPKNFTGVVADKVEVLSVAATPYDQNTTILSFNLKSEGGTIAPFRLGLGEENFTLLSPTEGQFYTIIPRSIKKVEFYYFSPNNGESFEKVEVPLNLKLEQVTTQTDIRPENNLLDEPVNVALMVVSAIGILAVLVYQRWWLLIFPLLSLGYFAYLNLPYRDKVLVAGAQVRILPTPQSTVFYTTHEAMEVKVLRKYKDYTKIYFQNRVGWVKNDQLR